MGWGGMGGAPMGGGGTPGQAVGGLPFGGIPPELQAGVDLLLAEEPDRGESDITFSHQASAHEKERLSLRGLLLEYPGMLVLAVVLVGIIAVATQLGPKLTGIAIDGGMEPGHHDFGFVVLIGCLYLLSVVVSAVSQWGQVRVTGRLASWVMNDLRTTIFRHLQRLSLDFFTEEKAGVVMSRMTSDIENLQQLLQDGLAQFAVQGLDQRLRQETHMPTHLAESPLTCVAVGSGRSLEEFEAMRNSARARARSRSRNGRSRY